MQPKLQHYLKGEMSTVPLSIGKQPNKTRGTVYEQVMGDLINHEVLADNLVFPIQRKVANTSIVDQILHKI
ncbi:unnamed protein product [Dovyalis caffra]|uniref:Uncharacterized protein n=1 Tax=Dovyalis caffra TaxID=77055 RepID=A0AAV1RB71_9ROSI|nr:unnamed protein product [Dovyalis caffra]